jgi:NitT/TauT family transport system substrate-binding protein
VRARERSRPAVEPIYPAPATVEAPGAVSRRDFLAAAGVAAGGVALLGVSACGAAGNGGGSKDTGTYKGQQAVAHLDEIISAAPFKIAEAQGYFEKEQLQLKSVSFPGGGDVVRAIQTKMHFGQPALVPLLIAHEKALKDIRVLAGSYFDPEVVFLVPKDSPIKSPKDLRGKKVGVSEPGSNSTYFGTKLIERAGLKPGKDAKIVSVGGPSDASTAADHGVVDVAWSTPPLATKEEKAGKKRLLIKAAELEPSWVSVVLATRQPFIDSNPKVLQRWVNALQRSEDLIHNDTKRAGRVWAKSIEIDPEITTAALEEYKGAFKLAIDRKAFEANVRAGKELGQLKSEPNLDEIIEDKFLPAGARA